MELFWNYINFKLHLKQNYLELLWNHNNWCKTAKTGETGKSGETGENSETGDPS